NCKQRGLPLRELEALAGALAAVFLAFLHAAVAGEIAGVAELLGHADDRVLAVAGVLGRQAEHLLERAGDTLAGSAGLTREAAAANLDRHVELVAHVGQFERAVDGRAILVLREELVDGSLVHGYFARAFGHAHAGDGFLAPAGAEVKLLLGSRFR